MTAYSRLPVFVQDALSLVESVHAGLDKVHVCFCDPAPDLPLEEIKRHCHSANLVRATLPAIHSSDNQQYAHHDFLSQLTISGNTLESLRLISQSAGTRHRNKINTIELALDLVTKNVEHAQQVLQLMKAMVLPDRNRFHYAMNIYEGTAYVNNAQEYGNSTLRLVMYVTPSSKFAPGKPACHIELRLTSLEEVMRFGIGSVHDLLQINFRELWRKHLRLFHFSMAELGALISPPQLSERAKRDRARKFIERTGHDGELILHDAVLAEQRILEILKPIDTGHFLPPHVPAAPLPLQVPAVLEFTSKSTPRARKKPTLTAEQRAVIEIPTTATSAVVVQACAGSGKTHALLAFIAYLIASGFTLPSELLVLGFAKKTVREIMDRLGIDGLRVPTLHAFAFSLLPQSDQDRLRAKARQTTVGGNADDERGENSDSYAESIRLAARLLRSGKISLPRTFKFLFVDEFQDLDADQFEFVLALQERIPHVRLFGDELQAIRGDWAGKQSYDHAVRLGATTQRFTISHRLTKQNALFVQAVAGVEITGTGDGLPPLLIFDCTHQASIDALIFRIKKLLKAGTPPSEIVVLVRWNKQQRAIDRALIEAGINAELSSIKDPMYPHVETMLRLLSDAMQCVEGKPTRQQYRKVSKLLQRYTYSPATPLSKEQAKECRRRFWAITHTPSFAGKFEAASRLFVSLQKWNPHVKNIEKEFHRWSAVAAGFCDPEQFRTFVETLTLKPAITVSTVHSFKGGEADHVFIVGCVDGIMPHCDAKLDFEARARLLQVERNTLYVAMTRARKRLYIFESPWFALRPGKEGVTFDQPSRLIPDEALAYAEVRSLQELRATPKKKSAPKGRPLNNAPVQGVSAT